MIYTHDKDTLQGESYAYAAMPVERAQRLSTVASAANAMQLAMALSAVLPTQGLSLNGAAAYQELAVGTIDARERVPLVIGFADRALTAPSNPKPAQQARFGWLFGPPLHLDTENDQLVRRHTVANHRVLADISAPAWWPSATLQVRSAWIGNWRDTNTATILNPDRYMTVAPELEHAPCGKKLSNQFCQPITVQLPQNSADLHALTEQLARRYTQQPLRAPQIDRIEPNTISACADQVEFFVYGVDLWQNPEANLRGVKESDFCVLPDMAGIAVTFDIAMLPPSPHPRQDDKLWIVTQHGRVGGNIEIAGDRSRRDSGCGHTSSQTSLALDLESSPILDHRMASTLRFRVTNGALPTSYFNLFVRLETPNTNSPLLKTQDLMVVEDRQVLEATDVKFPGKIRREHDSASIVASVRLFSHPGVKEEDATVLADDFPLLLCRTNKSCKQILAKATVAVPSDTAPIQIEFNLPSGFGRIYPGLGQSTSRLGGYIDVKLAGHVHHRIDLEPVSLDFPTGNDWRTGQHLTLSTELHPPLEGDDAATYRQLIRQKHGANLHLVWVMTEWAQAPESPGKLQVHLRHKR